MAAELFRVRSKFIDKVSEEVISQLLDDLLEDCVLNDGENDAVLKKNQTQADRARALIDSVRKKGDVASRKMIARLQARDPTLSYELGLSAGQPAQPAQLAQPAQPAQLAQPAQPAAEPGEEQGWSDKLILTTEALWKQKQNDKDVYPAGKSNIRNRVALLITNIKFKDKRLNREGAEKDEENMERLLSALGYEVVRRTDLTAEEIDEALIKFSKHPKLKETDSVVVVLMSHGKLGTVYGVNWTEEQPDDFPIDNINQHLGSEECPALLDKPKVIIIQACRGGDSHLILKNINNMASGAVKVSSDSATQAVGLSDLDILDDGLKLVHKEKDFISLLSSTPHTKSYRDPDKGSFLIQFIVEVFKNSANKDDIEVLFRKVMQRFEDLNIPFNRRQMPVKDRCTLTKRFYFQPDKELARVRGRFVEKVSKPLLKQLLDDLLEDGLLNDGETDSVLEDNSGKADMARCLIDMVKRKGDRASTRMIGHIERRDPTLFSELGLSLGPPAAAAPQRQQTWSDKLILTSDSFRMGKLNDPNIYPVTEKAIKSRVALLIININFANRSLTREGADKDEENMERLLKTLGYEVVKFKDLTGQGIDDALRNFSKNPKLKDTDSVFVVIMSHGKRGLILGVNYDDKHAKKDEFPVDNIYKYLDSKTCPALLNKPKIIIIQACRGESGGAVNVISDSATQAVVSDDLPPPRVSDLDILDDSVKCVHKEKDFISLLSSTPDTVSYRHRNDGSFLIQYIVEVFNTYSHEDDIEELFRKVMQRFENFSAEDKRQMPTKDRCTLTRRFYLLPGP
ncbi:uncharacterized protein LOC125013841 [Mugil cephalus]|uniref:uncharacterized protein LOC125013841 n=1 Tax=Mugil cephalus TaxID=48193 RepID=UPI001FB7AABC|nr:uncharacterized protein LOC125013841 [Mugil cephalus]